MSLKILFLTTHNLATNPRLVKEMKLALEKGYEVELICFEFNNWSKEINEKLKQQLPNVNIVSIPAGRTPFLPWFWSIFKETFFRIAGKFISLSIPALSQAVSRRSSLLSETLNRVSTPDWVIGHNAGALWPTVKASDKFKCAAGFDVEDYHPGEGKNKYLQHLCKKLMIALLKKMKYVSFASPLIMNEMQKDVGKPYLNWFTVLNYAPAADFIRPSDSIKGRLKLVWFSQNINKDRGLELILPFVKNYLDSIELHLIGNVNGEFFNNYLKDEINICIHAPVMQRELHRSLAQFDIGLALEPAKDLNNELALSNKLLAYLQAGLFVMATNTAAQEHFLKEFPAYGTCFNHRENNFEETLKYILENKELIRAGRSRRFQNFTKRNWNIEATRLLSTWNLLTV